jgi:DNA mismatch repair protein MutL
LPEGWAYLGDLQSTYLLVSTEDALLIIDQHALAKSIAYQALLKGETASQELLIPEILQLGAKEAVLYDEYASYLEEVGFSTRLLGSRTVLVTKVPVILGKALSPDSLTEILISAYSDREEGLNAGRILAKAQLATAACHSSVRGNERLTREEAISLISQLSADPSTLTCPHGRPTVYRMPYTEIARFFGR